MEIHPSTPPLEEIRSPLVAKLVGILSLLVAAIASLELLMAFGANERIEQVGHVTFGISGLVLALLIWSWSRALTWIHSIAQSTWELAGMSPEALSELKTVAKEARAQASLRDMAKFRRSDPAASQRDLSPAPDTYRL